MTSRACKQCRRIISGKICPVCKIEAARNYQGVIVVFDTNSEIAKKMGITAPGQYALKV